MAQGKMFLEALPLTTWPELQGAVNSGNSLPGYLLISCSKGLWATSTMSRGLAPCCDLAVW